MKNILLAWLLVMCIRHTAYAQIISARLTASGLTCSMCNLATQKQLETIDDIDSITPDIEHNSFVIVFKQGREPNPADLRSKVEDAGFFIAELILFYKIKPLQIQQQVITLKNMKLYANKPIDPSQPTPIALKIIEKGFITEKAYKKNSKLFDKQYTLQQDAMKADLQSFYHVLLQ